MIGQYISFCVRNLVRVLQFFTVVTCGWLLLDHVTSQGNAWQKSHGHREGVMDTNYLHRQPSEDVNILTGFQFPIATTRRVLYSPLGGCATDTVTQVLEAAASRNGFTLTNVKVASFQGMTEVQESRLAETLSTKPTFTVVNAQIRFVDFTRYNMSAPVFINVIRDPLERAVSRFLSRQGSGQTKKMTYDLCVALELPECMSPVVTDAYLRMFCGSYQVCQKYGTVDAFSRAKTNIQKYFAFIGVVEDVRAFFQLAELLYPQYFEGAAGYYDYAGLGKGTQPRLAHNITDATRHVMENVMEYDFRLYNFVKQRFYGMYSKYIHK